MFTIYNDNILLLNIFTYTLYNDTEYNDNNNNVTYLWQRSLCIITMSLFPDVTFLSSNFYTNIVSSDF